MEVEFFDTAEAAAEALTEAMKAADARVVHWQAQVKPGDCFVSDSGVAEHPGIAPVALRANVAWDQYFRSLARRPGGPRPRARVPPRLLQSDHVRVQPLAQVVFRKAQHLVGVVKVDSPGLQPQGPPKFGQRKDVDAGRTHPGKVNGNAVGFLEPQGRLYAFPAVHVLSPVEAPRRWSRPHSPG